VSNSPSQHGPLLVDQDQSGDTQDYAEYFIALRKFKVTGVSNSPSQHGPLLVDQDQSGDTQDYAEYFIANNYFSCQL